MRKERRKLPTVWYMVGRRRKVWDILGGKRDKPIPEAPADVPRGEGEPRTCPWFRNREDHSLCWEHLIQGWDHSRFKGFKWSKTSFKKNTKVAVGGLGETIRNHPHLSEELNLGCRDTDGRTHAIWFRWLSGETNDFERDSWRQSHYWIFMYDSDASHMGNSI